MAPGISNRYVVRVERNTGAVVDEKCQRGKNGEWDFHCHFVVDFGVWSDENSAIGTLVSRISNPREQPLRGILSGCVIYPLCRSQHQVPIQTIGYFSCPTMKSLSIRLIWQKFLH
jgi:hypothetical protein